MMKKGLFLFVFAMMATMVMAQEAKMKTEVRDWYSIEVPEDATIEQTDRLMNVTFGNLKLTFLDAHNDDASAWISGVKDYAKEQLPDMKIGDHTWHVFQHFWSVNTVYVRAINKGVIRISSSSEDANEPAVIAVINSIKILK